VAFDSRGCILRRRSHTISAVLLGRVQRLVGAFEPGLRHVWRIILGHAKTGCHIADALERVGGHGLPQALG